VAVAKAVPVALDAAAVGAAVAGALLRELQGDSSAEGLAILRAAPAAAPAPRRSAFLPAPPVD
jgi:hypothetical protein